HRCSLNGFQYPVPVILSAAKNLTRPTEILSAAKNDRRRVNAWCEVNTYGACPRPATLHLDIASSCNIQSWYLLSFVAFVLQARSSRNHDHDRFTERRGSARPHPQAAAHRVCRSYESHLS